MLKFDKHLNGKDLQEEFQRRTRSAAEETESDNDQVSTFISSSPCR